jgi:hypothetical protein
MGERYIEIEWTSSYGSYQRRGGRKADGRKVFVSDGNDLPLPNNDGLAQFRSFSTPILPDFWTGPFLGSIFFNIPVIFSPAGIY